MGYPREEPYQNWKHEKRRLAQIAAIQREEKEAEERSDRWQGLWNVPERACDEYMAMEDNFCPETVLEFMKAMLPEEAT